MSRLRRYRLGIVALAALSLSAAPARSGPAREGSFTATAVPWAGVAEVTYAAVTAPPKVHDGCGIEGVHNARAKFTAPAYGVLTVTMDGFRGDWNLSLLDSDGEAIGWSAAPQLLGAPPTERIVTAMRRGARLTIVACNWSSPQHEVVVRYRFVPGDGFRARRADHAAFRHLSPRGPAGLTEEVPVNVVFLGYDHRQVSEREFRSVLPRKYRPLVRGPFFYGIQEFLGIEYSYRPKVIFTDGAYEDRFFAMLLSVGRPAQLTGYQTAYNEQEKNVIEVKSNFEIDAVTVERWLARNPPRGVAAGENTVVFINWFGRRDFRFHVYRKAGEADSDVYVDYGKYGFNATIAWGGTPADDEESGRGPLSRVWFYDLSAGPEYWSGSYLVDDADLDDDGIEDYRLPPVWEYRTGGYRTPAALSRDLGKVARYVAIDLLFTTSPLYTPAIGSPLLPESIELDLNNYVGWLDRTGYSLLGGSPYADVGWLLRPLVIREELQQLMPLNRIGIDVEDRPFLEDPRFFRCYTAFYSWLPSLYSENPYLYAEGTTDGPSCEPTRPYVNWQSLYLHHALRAPEVLDDLERADYEVGAHTYFPPDDTLGYGFAYADDNQYDGTPSMVHFFFYPSLAKYIGVTDVLIHEFGHHFGMSHPHDGYDYEDGVDFGSWMDRFSFAASGDQSNTVMSYMFANNDFSQFDRDNRNRWMTAAHLEAANTILARVLAHPRASAAMARLRSADETAGRARAAFATHRYLDAYRAAKMAYDAVLGAARSLGISVAATRRGLHVHDGALVASLPSVAHPAVLDRFAPELLEGVPVMRPARLNVEAWR